MEPDGSKGEGRVPDREARRSRLPDLLSDGGHGEDRTDVSDAGPWSVGVFCASRGRMWFCSVGEAPAREWSQRLASAVPWASARSAAKLLSESLSDGLPKAWAADWSACSFPDPALAVSVEPESGRSGRPGPQGWEAEPPLEAAVAAARAWVAKVFPGADATGEFVPASDARVGWSRLLERSRLSAQARVADGAFGSEPGSGERL